MVWIGMAYSMWTDTFHYVPVWSPVSRPIYHMVFTRVMNDTVGSPTIVLIVDPNDLSCSRSV